MVYTGNLRHDMATVKKPSALTRKGRAQKTHWRIVKAAFELFCERGYAGTTMALIAKRAGVAVQTVYFVFHTKSELLSRSYDFAVMGETTKIPQRQPWHARAVAAPDIRTAIREFVIGVGEITRRLTPLYVVARAAAESDADIARVVKLHEDWRIEGYRQVLEDVFLAKAPLRAGLTRERATHLLLLYVGMDVYHALVDGSGWTDDEWAEWTVATIAEQLF